MARAKVFLMNDFRTLGKKRTKKWHSGIGMKMLNI